MLLIPKFMILKTLFPVLAFVMVWDMIWKWIALYKAAQKKEIWRFVCILIFNTCGILPIVYLLLDSKDLNEDTTSDNNKSSSHKKDNELKKSTKWKALITAKKSKKSSKSNIKSK